MQLTRKVPVRPTVSERTADCASSSSATIRTQRSK